MTPITAFFRRSLLATTMVAASASVFVATPARAEVPALKKVAMVDMQKVLNDTTAGKKARKELESSSKSKQAKLDKKRERLEADAAKLKNMQGNKLATAQEKLQQESMELQSMMYALDQELGQQHNQLLERMYKNAQAIVAKLAKARGIDLVIVRDQMTVIYTQDSLDITPEVVKLYNQKHPS